MNKTINYQFKTRQICLFIISFIPITKMFMMPSIMAEKANEDLWIAAILNFLLDFLTILFLIYTFKNENKDFFESIEELFGKKVKVFILVIYLIYFIFKAYIPINEQKDYVEQTFYITMPNILTFMPFFLIAIYLCAKKMRVLGRCADLAWLTTIIGTFLLVALSISNINIEALLPIGINGAKNIFYASYRSLTWFGDCAYFLFFVGSYKHHKGDSKKILLSYLLCAVIVLTFLVLFYCTFTSMAYRQRFALTEISKYNTIINNLGRFDYIGIMLILFSSTFSLILPLFFACKILERIIKTKNTFILPIIVNSILILLLTVFAEYSYSIENFIFQYMGIYFIFCANVFPIIFCIIKKIKLKGYKKTLPLHYNNEVTK